MVKQNILLLYAATGSTNWCYTFPSSSSFFGYHQKVSAKSPIIATNHLIIFAAENSLFALSSEQGTIEWVYYVKGTINEGLVTNNKANCVLFSTDMGEIVCVDYDTGLQRWVYTDPLYFSYSSPYLDQEWNVIVRKNHDSSILKLDSFYGNIISNYKYSLHQTSTVYQPWFTPVSVSSNISTISDDYIYDVLDGYIVASDKITGNIVWTRNYTISNQYVSKLGYSMISYDSKQIYLGTNTEYIISVNSSNGDMLWHQSISTVNQTSTDNILFNNNLNTNDDVISGSILPTLLDITVNSTYIKSFIFVPNPSGSIRILDGKSGDSILDIAVTSSGNSYNITQSVLVSSVICPSQLQPQMQLCGNPYQTTQAHNIFKHYVHDYTLPYGCVSHTSRGTSNLYYCTISVPKIEKVSAISNNNQSIQLTFTIPLPNTQTKSQQSSKSKQQNTNINNELTGMILSLIDYFEIVSYPDNVRLILHNNYLNNNNPTSIRKQYEKEYNKNNMKIYKLFHPSDLSMSESETEITYSINITQYHIPSLKPCIGYWFAVIPHIRKATTRTQQTQIQPYVQTNTTNSPYVSISNSVYLLTPPNPVSHVKITKDLSIDAIIVSWEKSKDINECGVSSYLVSANLLTTETNSNNQTYYNNHTEQRNFSQSVTGNPPPTSTLFSIYPVYVSTTLTKSFNLTFTVQVVDLIGQTSTPNIKWTTLDLHGERDLIAWKIVSGFALGTVGILIFVLLACMAVRRVQKDSKLYGESERLLK